MIHSCPLDSEGVRNKYRDDDDDGDDDDSSDNGVMTVDEQLGKKTERLYRNQFLGKILCFTVEGLLTSRYTDVSLKKYIPQ